MKTQKEIKKLIDENFDNTGSISMTIAYARSLNPELIPKPKKPILVQPYDSRMALKFSQDLKQYEDDIEIYSANERIRKEYVNIIDNEILEFIRTEAGLYDTVPKQYQDKVWSRANEDGHSSGMYEVYLKLCNLVEIFE